MRIRCLTALILAAPLASLHAQIDPAKIPKRPELSADRDTNSASDYFYFGGSVLNKMPERAAAAFYWASRLDPTWADPFYGRYVALLLAQPEMVLTGYLTRRPGTLRDPIVRRIDSLAYQALLRNPFVDRRFDGILLEEWLFRETGGTLRLPDLAASNPRFAGWLAYANGRFQESTALYATALARGRKDPSLHLQRALPFVALGLMDSARSAVQTALTMLRGSDTAQALYAYESYPFAEYSIGILYENGNQPDSARAAYERALLDDLTFYPAHRRLARIRLATHDTAGAMAEYTHATATGPPDAGGLFELAVLLAATGHTDSAVTLLRQTTEAEPWFARPHALLGLIYERSGFRPEASDQYRSFLRLAARSMAPEIQAVSRRLALLSDSSASP